MKQINALSRRLEEQSGLRVAEAERSDSLKDSLRRRLQRYSDAESEFDTKMRECEEALAANKMQKQFDEKAREDASMALDDEKKKKRRNKKKKAAASPADGAAAEAEAETVETDTAATAAAEQTDQPVAVEAVGEKAGEDEEAGEGEGEGPDAEAEERLREEREESAFTAALDKEAARTDVSRLHIFDLVASEKEIRAQLSEYADRFERFQDALNKSNELFGGFKLRMEEMAGTIHSLEKQNRALADKERTSEGVLAGLQRDHAAQLAEAGRSEQQAAQLGSLVAKLRLDNESKRQLLDSPSVPSALIAPSGAGEWQGAVLPEDGARAPEQCS
jgi:hypothetical protein